MTPNQDNLNRLLSRAMQGGIDEFSVDEVAELERHLNLNHADAGKVAAVGTAKDKWSIGAALPNEREWSAVWNGIESAMTAPRAAARKPDVAIRAFPWFRGMTAAAACLALMLVWRFGPATSTATPSSGWALQLSPENHILELSLSASAPPTVHYSDDGVAIIAFDDAPAAPEGASDDDDSTSNTPVPPDSRNRLAR